MAEERPDQAPVDPSVFDDLAATLGAEIDTASLTGEATRTDPVPVAEPAPSTALRTVMAQRVEEVRRRRGLTKEALSSRLSALGYPMHPTALTKISNGTRGVSVEDLVALAAALNVSPVNLLLPADPESRVTLVPERTAPAHAVRRWLYGQDSLGLSGDTDDDYYAEAPDQERRERRHESDPLVSLLWLMRFRVMVQLDRATGSDEARRDAQRFRRWAKRIGTYAGLLAEQIEERLDEHTEDSDEEQP